MKPSATLKILTVFLFVFGIQAIIPFAAMAQQTGEMRVAFWNMENFFDPFVDSTKVYNEFTEEGGQHWNYRRFHTKRNNMYKAILAFSENKPLAVFGIAEVENLFVLNMLFTQTPLKNHNYRIVHYEGDDRRGIDVALVYCIDKLQLIYSEGIKLRNPHNRKFRSRDILYVKLADRQGDTLHCFVNHWPSRYGGERETVNLRLLAANTLKHKVDSLVSASSAMPKIIIMGDFNDSPEDPSLQALTNDGMLVNLFADTGKLGFEGTLKHQYNWQIFDQIIVSKALINKRKGLVYKTKSATIYHGDFLFVKDETYGGLKLFRTYIGPKYQGGYSDHLPVFIDLIYK